MTFPTSPLIYVVDDAPVNLALISGMLQRRGYDNLRTFERAQDALTAARKHSPALMLLDIVMPEMSGLELCALMRADPDFTHLPIIAQTALTEPSQKVAALRAGATDIIHKPLDPDEMVTRVRIHLERHTMLSELRLFRERMEQEMKAARSLQTLLMPADESIAKAAKRSGLEIAATCLPSSELNGDLWDCRAVSPTALAVTALDVSGHGTASALNTFRIHTLMQMHARLRPHPDHLLGALSETLYSLLPAGQFVTLFHGIIDRETHSVRYASAATPPGWVLSPGCEPKELDGRGLPLGIRPWASYPLRESAFPPGSSLILVSDAFSESPDAAGRFLKLAPLLKDLNLSWSALDQKNWILQRFYEHACLPLPDDLTVICIRWP